MLGSRVSEKCVINSRNSGSNSVSIHGISSRFVPMRVSTPAMQSASGRSKRNTVSHSASRRSSVRLKLPSMIQRSFRSKFRFGNGRFVRPVPEKIERIERQPGPVPQPPGKRALSRPGTADHEDFFHGSLPPVIYYFCEQRASLLSDHNSWQGESLFRPPARCRRVRR